MLFVMLAVLLVPWLGETLFNTKGEPREAIVAISMLKSGNWILPVSYGADIPYKPPFLAWLIALFSKYLNGGVVNEFTSRLPSALAAIALVMGGYSWARRYMSVGLAAIMALVTITSFEVYRAAMACRVDMLLTACMVLALYQMYQWRQGGRDGQRWWLRQRMLHFGWALLLLSGAVLTKGPVGALLPCLVMGIFCLLRGDNFFKSLGWLGLLCICSFIIPALWYWQAYLIGGDHFAALAWEENIGRLTGNMGYDSHVNPWHYNLVTIVAGMLPWTVLALAAGIWIFFTPWARSSCAYWLGHFGRECRKMSAPVVFAWVAAIVVLAFYCIPSSKRSVYLLPMYPFMALGVAWIMSKVRDTACLRAYRSLIVAIALILPVAAIAAQWIPMKHPLDPMPWWRYPLALAPWIAVYIMHKTKASALVMTLGATLAIYFAYSAAYQPMILNGKSDIKAVPPCQEVLERNVPIYTYIAEDSLIRYYTLNFYLGDRLQILDPTNLPPRPFALLCNPADVPAPLQSAPADTITPKSCDTRRPIILVNW